MKKFQFSLEKVKNFREKEEKFLQKELIDAKKIINIIIDEIEEINKEIIIESKKLEIIITNQHNSEEYLSIYNYLKNLENKKHSKENDLHKANENMDNIKNKLISKSIECKMLEKLKEIKQKSYYSNIKKIEQTNLDEIAIQKVYYGAK